MDGWLPEPEFSTEKSEWDIQREQDAFASLVNNAIANGGAPKLELGELE